MFRKTFWGGMNVLLLVSLLLFCLTQVQCEEKNGRGSKESDGDKDNDEDKTKILEKSKPYDNDASDDRSGGKDKDKKSNRGKDKDKKSDEKYGQDMIGDYSKDRDRGRGRYSDSDERRSSNKGIDPDTYGQDLADRKDIYEDKDLMVGSIEVWIRNADRWDEPDKYPYRPNQKNYGKDSKKYSKDRDYKDRDYKDRDYKDRDYKDRDYKDRDYKRKDKNYKGKDSDDDYDRHKGKGKGKGKGKYEKVVFPVRSYKSYKKFPHKRLPPLFNALPWTPIFYDKLTYQTFIYCPTGHFLILPPLINFFGQRFAVAQLIKWGYASLISTGIPPGPGFNAAPLVQPAGGPGAPPPPSVPYNPRSGQYNGGVTTNYGSFKPRDY